MLTHGAWIRGIAILIWAAGVAAAVPLTWRLENVQFSDGGIASGTFVFDADTGALTNWDLVTQGGTGPGLEYTPANSVLLPLGYYYGFITPSRSFSLNFPYPYVTDAGGTVGVIGSLELSAYGDREVVLGSASTVPPSSLNPGDQLVGTFTTKAATEDILLIQNGDALTVSGVPTLTTNLYDGQKLLGTYSSGPLSQNGVFSFLATFASPGGGSGITLDSPTTVDFSSLQAGTIQGSFVTTISGGSISGLYATDTAVIAAATTGANSYASTGSIIYGNIQINCPTALPAAPPPFGANGGTATVQVTAASGCPWTVTTSSHWIHLSTAAGSFYGGVGDGSFSYSVDPNTDVARTGSIQVGPQTLSVNQAGSAQCVITLPVGSTSVGGGSGSGTFALMDGTGCSWAATASVAWIHITSGAAGSGNGTVAFSVDANPGAARSGSIQVGTQAFTINQTVAGPPLPTISTNGVADPWTYTQGIAPGAWISIYGTNLANTTQTWSPQSGQPLPTSLAGVTVTIEGTLAPLAYVSPTLINALAPAGVGIGQVSIVVTNQANAGTPFQIRSTPFLPTIYSNADPVTSPARFDVTAVDPVTGEYLGNAAADARVTRAAQPGETIDLYALGLGPATPFTTDTAFSGSYPVSSTFSVVLGGVNITPGFAALVGPGLYQVRITVPATMSAGNQPIVLDFGSAQSAPNVSLNIQN